MNLVVLCVLLTVTPEDRTGADRFTAVDRAFLEGIVRLIAEPLKAVHTEVKRAGDNWERTAKSVERLGNALSFALEFTPWVGGGLAGVLLTLMFSRQTIQVKRE